MCIWRKIWQQLWNPLQWAKKTHLSPALSMHHSRNCDKIPKEREIIVLIHMLHALLRGCSGLHLFSALWSAVFQGVMFMVDKVAALNMGSILNTGDQFEFPLDSWETRRLLLHIKHIYALLQIQVNMKGKQKSSSYTLGSSDGAGQKATDIKLEHGKLLLDIRRKIITIRMAIY